MIELLNLYNFFPVVDPLALGKDCYALARDLELKGSILFAPEGCNLALSGKPAALDSFLKEKILLHTSIAPAYLRRTKIKEQAYSKLKLKLKEELVKSDFKLSEKERRTLEGSYLSPEKFQALAENEKICFLDLRNDYESMIGTFRGALCLALNEFSQLTKLLSSIEPYRDRDLVTFCTGGVRCEKAVPLLKREGFRAFQLEGGILHYLEKYGKKEENLWEGECFVFDERVSLNAKLEKGSYEWCKHCGQPSRSGVCVICGQRES